MSGVFNVRDYGAQGDGRALDTAAVQSAVDAAAVAGGRVAVPPGTYLCGTIVLKSRVTLDLCAGARILGSPRLEDYSPRDWGHNKDITRWHLILAEGAEQVAITGEGEIDGNGPAFWEPDRPHDWSFWKERRNRVSPMVQFDDCRHVRIEGVTMRNTPGWTVHLRRCEHAAIRGVVLRNGLFGPNNDGLDINGCRYVTVSDCDIETGDDAIVLKTTHDAGPTEYVTVTNCVLRTSCVALKLGTESWHAFRHITFSNCVVPSCSRAVSLISFDGGDIEHVLVSGVTGTTNSGWPVNRPIEIYSECRARGEADNEVLKEPRRPPVPGRIRDVTLRDVDLVTDGRVMMVARKDRPLEDITVEGLRLRYVLLEDPSGLGKGGWIPGEHADARTAPAAIVAENIRGLRLANVQIRWPEYPVPGDWHVLETRNRAFNRNFYAEGREDAIRKGAYRVPFAAYWARDVKGDASLGDLTGSEGGPARDVETVDSLR